MGRVASKNFEARVLSQIASIGVASTNALIARNLTRGLSKTGALENAIQATGIR
jgi:hypothetical protein